MDSKVKQLSSRAESLANKFLRGGERDKIDEAIALDREALELCPPGHSMRSHSLGVLSSHLGYRYDQLGEVGDLDEAIVLHQERLALCSPGNPKRSGYLTNLARRLLSRYNVLGTPDDLNESVVLSREALSIYSPGNATQSSCLGNIASSLYYRYMQLGAQEDLNQAIVHARKALALWSPGMRYHSTRLNNLAKYLVERSRQLGTPEDINEAIGLDRDALASCPLAHPARSRRLNYLANHILDRYNQLGSAEDLNEAILLSRDSLARCPPRHPARSLRFNNLANCLYHQYKQLGALVDLNEAISLSRDALSLCTPGHPNRSPSLDNLANHLSARFTCSSQLKDKEELFELYTYLADIPPAVSSSDLSAARSWVRAAEEFRHSTTLLAYETFLQLLIRHLTTLPSLPRHLDLIKSLTSSLAMDAFSACLRNHSPTKAVELLEQGRSVFLGQLTRLRSPLDDVTASGPAGKTLGEKFTQLTSLIRNASDSPGEDQHDRVYRLNVELSRVVASIRDLPGLSRFLLPSLFSDLQKAASGGPVIIVNASKYSCDALVVLLDRDPVHIPLRITRDRVRDLSTEIHALTKRAKLENVGKFFAVVLRELWQKVVSPIVDFLRTIHPLHSRIWWCPTAEFSLLPLHAAGSYRTGQQKLFDLYISSYTPTLTALIRARRGEPTNLGAEWKHFVGIGQAKAAGETELHSVSAELANLGDRVKSLAVFRSIEGSDSSISRVAEELNKNEWVHFACHGLPNRKQPFDSAFALHDGHFTVERIIRCELQNAQFAYLSACHTTVGDDECPDEMIHLASAMQFAGFRSVIGTMWAVDDSQTKKITSTFYDNMVDASGRLDHTRAALALHKMMRTLVEVSFDQRILYIHLGA